MNKWDLTKNVKKSHGNRSLLHFEPLIVHFLQCVYFQLLLFFETYLDFWNIDDNTSVSSFIKWSSNIMKWNGKTRKQGQDAYCLTDWHTHSLKGKETQQIHFLFESNPSTKKRTRDNNSKVSCLKRATNCQGKNEAKASNKIIDEIQSTLWLCQPYFV